MHTCRIQECEDAAKKTEVHEEGKQDASYSRGSAPRKDQADIHGDTAQLEGEIPPVVGSVVYYKSETVLFPYFTYQK